MPPDIFIRWGSQKCDPQRNSGTIGDVRALRNGAGIGEGLPCQTTHQGLARNAAAPRIDRPTDRHLVDPDRRVPTQDVQATPGRVTASRRAATATGAHPVATATGAHRVATATEGHPAVTMALRIGADHPARTAPRALMSRQRAAVGRSTVLTSIPMP